MLMEFILAAVKSIAAALLLTLIYRQAWKPARLERSSGKRVLKFGWLLRVVSLITVISLGLAGGSLFFNPALPRSSVWMGAASAVAFSALVAFLVAESLWSRVVFDRETITSHSPWRRPRTLFWTEIVTVSYSDWSQCFSLVNERGDVIRVCTLYSGILEFTSELRTLLPRASYESVMSHPMIGGAYENTSSNALS